jgi:starch phosphorylase
VESQALYNILENEVAPCFYDRKNGDVPACWLEKMKASLKMVIEKFCSLRMVTEYTHTFYKPAADWHEKLSADSCAEARNLAARIARVRSLWNDVQIGPPARENRGTQRVGDVLRVKAEVTLGQLRPEEIDVELYYGQYKSFSELSDSRAVLMEPTDELGTGRYTYSAELSCEAAGRFGFSVRATPRGDAWFKSTPGLITWAAD